MLRERVARIGSWGGRGRPWPAGASGAPAPRGLETPRWAHEDARSEFVRHESSGDPIVGVASVNEVVA